MNWIVALIITALIWQKDWALGIAAGVATATLLGIEGAICDLRYVLERVQELLENNYPEGVGESLPMSVMRDSFLGQKVITPRRVVAWRLKRELKRANANKE